MINFAPLRWYGAELCQTLLEAMARMHQRKRERIRGGVPVNRQPLSFTALDKRILSEADGPASLLGAPRWMLALNMVGWFGVVLGVLPSVLVHVLSPAIWMLWLARVGLGLCLSGFAPIFVRSSWVLAKEFRHWRAGFMAQSDHDLARFRDIRQWLRAFSAQELDEHVRFVRHSRQLLASKIDLLAGGLSRLGILPALGAVVVFLFNQSDLSLQRLASTPLWVATGALFFAITYAIGMLAVRIRLVLQVHEALLSDSLQEVQGGRSEMNDSVATH